MEIVFTEFSAGEEQSAAFVAWRKLNPEGYILYRTSFGGPNGMLHLGRCSHWDGGDPRQATEATPKICTTTKFMMDRWIAANLPGEPELCSSCM